MVVMASRPPLHLATRFSAVEGAGGWAKKIRSLYNRWESREGRIICALERLLPYLYRAKVLLLQSRQFNSIQFNQAKRQVSSHLFMHVCDFSPISESSNLLACFNTDGSGHGSSRRIEWHSLHPRICPIHGTVEKSLRSCERGERNEGW